MTLSDTTPNDASASASASTPDIPYAIACMTSGEYHGHMTQGLLQTNANTIEGLDLTCLVLRQHGPYLEVGRNKTIAHTFDADARWRWLLLIDSDIGFNPTHVESLVKQAEHIYATRADRGEQDSFKGLVHTGVYPNFLEVFDDVQGAMADLHNPAITPDDFNARHRGQVKKCAVLFDQFDVPYGSVPGEPHRGVFFHAIPVPHVDLPPFPIDAAGAGFLLIHRDLITNMPNFFQFTYLDERADPPATVTVPSPSPWFDEVTYRGATLGEDMTFCMRVRALGGDVTVHPNVQLVHHKMCAITCD